ncbi:serine/threonine protein kinase [Pyxidicoccus xibeiensis]|uniref:serine/threonine protein kinase n=1 Tax=Pyxidicoccus xibeiensis TaxID=2906759 RepID=UPI0020A79261|nr:serine/threonine-protein kinase [Pyxidicoccus xibeiensis]MCP3142113.1 protein kinase [Pyxidicoccus xibeiensis]
MSGPVEDSRAYPWALGPGARVNRWRVLEPLGSGSYGAVYRVEDVDAPGVMYALKLALRPSDPRAEREVALLARTKHPNVVRVHDWGHWESMAGSHLYFVMDWVQGLPLHTWADTSNPPLRELALVAGSLALTLDWLHSRGVRHRDLKPEHILIRSSDSQPILIDFGVGRQEGASTLTSTVVPPGTVHLRSPEALDFHRLHFRQAGARYAFKPTDDLYALGVCLFRALTGHYPFPPEIPGDLLMLAILAHVPPPVAAINRRVPPALSEVVARLLEKKPQARYGAGHELHQALVAAMELGPVQAWEQRVFAWEAGSELADPSARRTVRPDWPTAPGTPPPARESPARARSTGGRFVGGRMSSPPSAVADSTAPALTLVRVDRDTWPRGRAASVTGRRRVRRAVLMVVGGLAVLGLVTAVASWRGGGVGASSEGLEAGSTQARPLADASVRAGDAPGGTSAPGMAVATSLEESPASADAAAMTQTQDSSDVKTPTLSKPAATKRVKTPDAVRAAVGAVAACLGAACSGPQQAEPPRALAALRQARPPPEECPQGSVEAMKELQIGKVGADFPDGSFIPFEMSSEAILREGPVVFVIEDLWGTLPKVGTTVAGRLFFAEGRVHGWFTEARTKDGRRFPVCMELMDGDLRQGMEVQGPGAEPGTVITLPVAKLGQVKRFK